MVRFRRSRRSALTGRYRTPFRDSGTRAMMISALKITADRIAESGEDRPMMLSLSRPG
jgi:hypothetical protein